MAEHLKLTALDAEDLAVISAHMQDAVLTLGDIRHLKSAKQFALVANRFAWETGQPERRRSGLHFDRVTKVSAQRIRQGDSNAIVSLLAISFEEKDPPSGDIILTSSSLQLVRSSTTTSVMKLRRTSPKLTACPP